MSLPDLSQEFERVLFTSDTHFGHEDVIRSCKRPFGSVEEMDEAMIERWNAVVGDDDAIFHLGDFALGVHPRRLKSIFERLNKGRSVRLILGNHDNGAASSLRWSRPAAHGAEIRIGKTIVTLAHYGHRTWRASRHGGVMLHGHSHGRLPGNRGSLDVGVDCWDFRPASWEEIQERLEASPRAFPPRPPEIGHDPRLSAAGAAAAAALDGFYRLEEGDDLATRSEVEKKLRAAIDLLRRD